jgi:hypothetical protein
VRVVHRRTGELRLCEKVAARRQRERVACHGGERLNVLVDFGAVWQPVDPARELLLQVVVRHNIEQRLVLWRWTVRKRHHRRGVVRRIGAQRRVGVLQPCTHATELRWVARTCSMHRAVTRQSTED